jgi:IMP cyclohydrolase
MVKTKEISRDALAKSLGLMDFSGDENFSPEIIDDALNSTSTFYENVGLADIAKRIKNNKAKHYGSSS